MIEALNAIGKESIKFKEEHIDGFVYTKHEEHFTLPLADVGILFKVRMFLGLCES